MSSEQVLKSHEDSHSRVGKDGEIYSHCHNSTKTTTQAQVLMVLKRIPREERAGKGILCSGNSMCKGKNEKEHRSR